MIAATSMSEDELLLGLTQALTLAGWRWSHHRRSDQALLQGDPGLPDIIAVHPTRSRALAWELKGTAGRPTGDQVAWIAGLAAPALRVDARILWPADYDRALNVIVGIEDPSARCVVCGRTADRILDPRTGAGLCIVCDQGV